MSEKADIDGPYGFPDHEKAFPHIAQKSSKIQSYLKSITKLLIAILAVYGLYSIPRSGFSRVESPTSPVICNCGNSISEAKSKDCKFDSLATAWLPSACRDDELTAEFERSGSLPNGAWPYYKDLRKEHLLTVEDLSFLADDEADEKTTNDRRHTARTYYVTAEWFVARCLFYWRKMERAKTLGTTIERSYLDTSIDGHNITNWRHCSNVFLARIPRDQIAAASVVGFGDPVD